VALGLFEASLPHFYFWYLGALQARKEKERKEKKRNLA
jgi:hypothetical protein